MGCSGFESISVTSTPKPRRTPTPCHCMQETMESMVGTRHFSCMDLNSGFWQVKMAEESRQYTAFTVGSMGVYKFLCICPTGCAMPQQRFSISCKTVWGS